MSTPNLSASGSSPEHDRIVVLIEQLQASVSWNPKGQWRAYLCAVLYGVIAALQGDLGLYAGVLVVVFLLLQFNEQRTRRQIDLTVQLFRELDKKNDFDAP